MLTIRPTLTCALGQYSIYSPVCCEGVSGRRCGTTHHTESDQSLSYHQAVPSLCVTAKDAQRRGCSSGGRRRGPPAGRPQTAKTDMVLAHCLPGVSSSRLD